MQWWCKKEGNKGSTMLQVFSNSPIFSTFVVRTFFVAKYRTVTKNLYHR